MSIACYHLEGLLATNFDGLHSSLFGSTLPFDYVKAQGFQARYPQMQKSERHRPPGGENAPTATAQFIYLRVHQSLVPPVTLAGLPPTRHLYLLEGTFSDIGRYAGTTVDWIIKVAHLICNPRGTGRLYTHTTKTASDWYHLDRGSSWRQVFPGDPLVPGIYEFESTRTAPLSKIIMRDSHSVVDPGSQDAVNFSKAIKLRDADKCAISNSSMMLFTSHLIPKRIGSDGAKDIVERFSGARAAVGIDKFDPRIGLLLNTDMDSLVVHLHLGFYHVAVSHTVNFAIFLLNMMGFREIHMPFTTFTLLIPSC
jgi:hypothetical protein